jgi:methyl-accepting chemotaxis protein
MQGKYGLMRSLVKPPHRSIGTRILLLFVCMVTVLVAAVGLLSYRIASQSLIGQAKATSEQTIRLAGEKLDVKQRFYQDLSNQLTHNNTFTDHLFQIAIPDIGADERERRMAEIRDMLGQLVLSDKAIRDITLIPLENEIAAISTIGQAIQLKLDEPWIEKVRANGGTPLWLPPRESGYLGSSPKPLIAYGKLLGKRNIGSRDFILLVQVDAAVLDDIADIQLSPGGNAAILDEHGTMLAMQTPTDVFASMLLPRDVEAGSMQSEDGRLLYAFRLSPVSGWTVVGSAPIRELTRAADHIRLITIAVIAGSVVAATMIGLMLVLAISRPLTELEALMAQTAAGNFRGRMRLTRQDEIGRVAEAYNAMAQQIGRLVAGTHRTVEELLRSSRQISGAATETAGSAAEVGHASEQIAKGAVGLSGIAEESAGHVERMSALQRRMALSASEADAASGQGAMATSGLLDKASATELRFRVVSERIDGLSGGAHAIHGLLQLMTDMAKQTKILSLNASIEAMRAGTAGAGFKVIADEIRALAEQSGASIGKVAGLTATIQAEVSATIAAIQEALPTFEEMIDEVGEVSRVMEDVQVCSAQVIACSAEVTDALEQLQQTQQLMAASIEEVAAVSEQSSASTEQVASLCMGQRAIGDNLVALSDKLKEVSANLEEQMNQFQVD